MSQEQSKWKEEILEYILLNLQKTNPDRNKRLLADGLTKAYDAGLEEGYKRGRIKTMEQHGDASKLSRTATLKECTEIGEKMKMSKLANHSERYLEALSDYQQQLEKLLNP